MQPGGICGNVVVSVQIKPSTKPVIPIGEMRDRITIQRPTTVPDDLGGQTVTWADLYESVPARVESVRAREPEILGRDVTARTFLITIRHGYDVTTTDRVSWGGLLLNIRSVENRDTMARRLTIECEIGFGT